MNALATAMSAPAPATGHFAVTQVRSSIAVKPKTAGTLRALGLGRIGKTNTLPDRPELRAMLRKVNHLVVVREPGDKPAAAKTTKSAPKSDPTPKS